MTVKLLVFILGAIVGSFLNVCIHRIPKRESIIAPGSHCPHCRVAIHWYDNIPIVSFILLLGRCRACRTKISLRYPIVEFLAASLILLFFVSFGLSEKFFAYAILVSGLIVATFVDFAIQEIPDEVSLGGLTIGLILSVVFPALFGETSRLWSFSNSVLGALAGGVSIYLTGIVGEFVFKKEAMGGGDVKLMAMIGAFLGWKLVLLTFFIAPFFGAGVGIYMKLKYGNDTIPYGPYLSLGAMVAILWGNHILRFLTNGLL